MAYFTYIFIKLPSQTLELQLSSRENYLSIHAHSGNKHRLPGDRRVRQRLNTHETTS